MDDIIQKQFKQVSQGFQAGGKELTKQQKTPGTFLWNVQSTANAVQEKIKSGLLNPLAEITKSANQALMSTLDAPAAFTEEAVTEITGSPIAGMVGGLAAGFLLPGGKRIKPDDAKFLADSAKAIKEGRLLKPKDWQIFQDTLKHYGLNVPQTKGGIPNQERAADFILTAQESSTAKEMSKQMSESLKQGRDKFGRFDFKK